MSCSIEAIKENLVDKASNVFTSSVKGITEVSPGVYEIRKSRNLSLNKAYERAQTGRNAVMNLAGNTYGEKFQFGWSTLDKTHPHKITVKLNVPSAVEQTIMVKLGLKSIEQANEMEPFRKDAENFSKDVALEEQEFISDKKFYEEVSENFPTLDVSENFEYDKNINELEYDNTKEFEYDTSSQTNTVITDAQLFRLLNDDQNIC